MPEKQYGYSDNVRVICFIFFERFRFWFILIISNLRDMPVFVMQIGSSIFHWNNFSLVSIFTAFFSSVLVRIAAFIENSTVDYRSLAVDYLNKFEHCAFIEYKIEDYVAKELLDEINFYRRGLDFKPLKIFFVEGKDGKPIPGQFVTYQNTIPSFIFVRSKPEKLTPIQRFWLYHEMGHIHSPNRNIKDRITNNALNSQLLVVWQLSINLFSGVSFFPLFILWIIGGRLRTRWASNRRRAQLEVEFHADAFAVKFMTDSDLKRCISLIEKCGFPKDNRLTVKEHEYRVGNLLKSIDSSFSGKKEKINTDFLIENPIFGLLQCFLLILSGYLFHPIDKFRLIICLCLCILFPILYISVNFYRMLIFKRLIFSCLK